MDKRRVVQAKIKVRILLVVLGIIAYPFYPNIPTRAYSQSTAPDFVPGEIIVKLKDEVSLNAAGAADDIQAQELKAISQEEPESALRRILPGTKIKKISQVFDTSGIEKIKPTGIAAFSQQEMASSIKAKFPQRSQRAPKTAQTPNLEKIFKIELEDKNTDVRTLAREISPLPNVEYAEPNFIMHALVVPNDPYYNSYGSWGQDYDDMWGLKKIQMSSAWDLSKGNPQIIVAVIDTGIDYNHPDIAANIWFNRDEIAGDGIDNDGNGYIDDVKGWNFCLGNNNPMDGHMHGTHVSGTIGAVTNNAQGVAGINWHVKLMALKGLSDEGSGSTSDLAEAIRYAADNGADVLSNSWGGSGTSAALGDAVNYAYSLGCIIVAAAGNDNSDASGFTPANIQNVIAVSAFDHNDQKAYFSNYGTKIDVAAPGVDILSTYSTFLEAPLVSSLNVISDNNKYLSSLPLEYSAKTPTGGVSAESLYAGLGYASDFLGKNFSGKIALIKRGDLNFSEKVQNAANAGASGVIIFNNESGNFLGTLGSAGAIPAVSISLEDGNYLLSLINTGQTITKMAVANSTDFYGHFSGTSMACPHVSGLAALILSRHPEFTNELVRAVIRASSDDIVEPLGDGMRYPGFDSYAGYGRINAYKALQIERIPLAKISSPGTNDVISGIVEILGTACGPTFHSYILEYGLGISPEQWFKIKDSTTPVEEGPLGTWNVNQLAYGIYTLRLQVQDNLFPGSFEDRVSLTLSFSYQQGWPVQTGGMVISSPALGDIDNDGKLEILVGSFDKKVYAWRSNGTPVAGWPKQTQGNVASSPLVVNLDKNGGLEIVVGSNDGYVYAWANNGAAVPGWPQKTEGAVFASPAAADIDGDGGLELVVGSYDGRVYAWHSDGTAVSGWPMQTGGPVVSSPALADLDKDGKLEIIIGSTDKKIYVWQFDGALLSGWPKDVGAQIASSPAIGDLDNNGFLDIVYAANNNKVYCRDKAGNLISGWPRSTNGAIESSPVLGDIDNDGNLEVVVGSFDKKVYAWHKNATVVAGWPQATGDLVVASPILVDINNDGFLDVLVGSYDSKLYAWDYDGKLLRGWPIGLGGAIESSAAFGDLDGDGDTELILGAMDNKVYAFDLDTGCLSGAIGWQMFKEAPARQNQGEAIFAADGSNGLLKFKVTATAKPTAGPLTFSAQNLPQGAQFDPLTQIFKWQPASGQLGKYNVTFNVTDGSHSDTETITINVLGNHPPYLYPIGDKIIYEGQLLEFYLRATDAEGAPLNFSAINLAQGAVFNPQTALFSWRPNFNQAGIYQNVHFEVSDGTSVDYHDIIITVMDAVSDTTPPAKPQLEPFNNLTNSKTILLAGTKEALSSIFINGEQVVPIGPETNWSYVYKLNEGNNHLIIASQDVSGNTSPAVELDIVLDTVCPAVTITNPLDGAKIELP